jgi:hypothetical protein
MAQLPTYLFPAIQAFIFLITAIAWFVGFDRQRNYGFLLLAIVFLAQGVLPVIRQAAINHVIGLPTAQARSYLSLVTWIFLDLSFVLWLLTALDAFLIAFHRPKSLPGQAAPPGS